MHLAIQAQGLATETQETNISNKMQRQNLQLTTGTE